MATDRPMNVLVLASVFKGERFMKQAHARGARVYLLTQAKYLNEPWPREALSDVWAQQDGATLQATIHTVSYLARKTPFDRIVALDDFDVEVAAGLREHLRLPGMGETQARFFRDKLACRVRLREKGIAVPDFTPVFNDEAVAKWIARVPAPWMLKPRSEASATGIHKVKSADELWKLLESKGDKRSFYLLEQFLPGDVYHADAITMGGKVIFSETGRCGDPPFDVAHGGGIFTTATLARGSDEDKKLRAFNEEVLAVLGYERGASHLEFIKAKSDGKFYLLETAARVGGARIAEMHEAATGVNLWEEWANVETHAGPGPYPAPKTRREYGGLIMTLSRYEHPDWSAYKEPEIFFHAPEKNHAGLVVRSPERDRVLSLLDEYKRRFVQDFHTSMPAPESST